MGTMPGIWKEQRIVESFDVDTLGRLRPQTLLAYLLNAAWNHTRGTHHGYEAMSARNLMWVLAKIHLRIHRMPNWGETIMLETWGKRIVRFFALRDFALFSGAGETLVSATSAWMILDRASGRPRPYDPESAALPWQTEKEALETGLEKVRELSGGTELARFRVLYSDIDVNRHVNSTHYLQWMMDGHSHDHLEAAVPGSIELSFLAEALPKDEVAVFAEGTEDRELCAVRRTGDGRDLCRAWFDWRRIE